MHPEMRDRLEPVGRRGVDAKGVRHVEAMRPRLHQSRRSHGRRAHRRPNHISFRPSATVLQRFVELSACGAPIGQQVRRRGQGWLVLRRRRRRSRTVRRGICEQRAESGFVCDRCQRYPVGPEQMRDLMGDCPTRGRCGTRPVCGRQGAHQRVEGVAWRVGRRRSRRLCS